ncbi:NADPH-dependent oxidoreductase [Companilactobacillus crustorum]|uniref:Nitroreductase (Oxidoreductase) n=3 Tax=Companilactobacillus TaxID=2767879 RepID=A0A837RF34_9LACO|nr:oxygen-insensitive NADPH nitroreductase [Companilactobacillus crustorum]APU71667.1 Oxygen-insensitive NADPH nitroreductase [Companilactobacillus crustorum]KRK41305.1 nitroreductase (oxidoreductase) [Companilactobacillus crustorum JCM 15951]KRO18698.1 nitroreductase (oxidoreductase) [Companilactobacillus crustorum]GEO77422.1 NADPH-dependent oxidoreductase [Companilactobacillus crustorum]
MNQTIDNLINHVSVRNFTDESITEDQKKQLVAAAQSGSTSEFVQAFSLIEITDPQLRKQISDITVSSPHVQKADTFYIFVADLNRQATMLKANNLSLDSLKNMESLLVATVDTTIAAQNMATAAESMGLGICYIGSIRNNIQQVAKLLELPKFTFPLFGMTIGVPAVKNQPKPRLFIQNQVATNTYDSQAFNDLTKYDQEVRKYYANRRTNSQDTTWTEKNLTMFDHIHRPEVASFLKEQGFSLN